MQLKTQTVWLEIVLVHAMALNLQSKAEVMSHSVKLAFSKSILDAFHVQTQMTLPGR